MPSYIRFFMLFLCLLGTTVFASIGKISLLKGEAYAQRESQKIALKSGSVLEEKDTIITAKDAQMQIIFEDKTVITLGSESELKIEEYFNDAAKPKAKFKFGEGSFKSITGQIGKTAPENFTLETKTATIGIRGTTIQGAVGRGGDTIACLSGTITVKAIGAPNFVVVPAGKSTFVAPGAPPTPPQSIQPSNGGTPPANRDNPPPENANGPTRMASEISARAALDVSEKAISDTIAQANSNINNYFFADTHTITASGQGSVGYTFVTLTQPTNLTVATYGPTTDPVIQVLNSSNTVIGSNDDDWTKSLHYYNAILTLALSPGTYKVATSNFSFSNDEALSGTNTNSYFGPITLHFSADKPIEITGNNITTYQNIPDAYGLRANYDGSTPLNPSATLNALIDSSVGTTVRDSSNNLYVSIPDSLSDSEHTDMGISWGYWISGEEDTSNITDQQNTWVAGIKTPTSVIDELIHNNTNYMYTGKVIGSAVASNGTLGYILNDATNAINLNINFGSSTINGSINFKTSLNATTWTANSFNLSSFGNTGFNGSLSEGNIAGGSIKGAFFGSTAQYVGGVFDASKNNGDKVIGAFKAIKQISGD